jgi:hypothetical protein
MCARSSVGRAAAGDWNILHVLRKYFHNRDVQSVHEVIIPDCPEHAHSDKDIEEALVNMDVRILDWRKKDISITTLRKVASNLDTLHLYSGGNSDVIEYWTSYQGLYRFPKVGPPIANFKFWVKMLEHSIHGLLATESYY